MKTYEIGQTKDFEAGEYGQYVNMAISHIHKTKTGMMRLTYTGQFKDNNGHLKAATIKTALFKP